MNRFCEKCGSLLREGAGFCGSCGTTVQQAPGHVAQSEFRPVQLPPTFHGLQPMLQGAPAPQPIPSPVAAAKASSPWRKVIVVVLIVIFVCGAAAVGGVIYVAHKVSQKAHEYSREVLGETAVSNEAGTGEKTMKLAAAADSSTAIAGDPCRLLSKEDVGRAIGVPILETSPADGGCSYLAKGTAAGMAAKHTAAMMGARGADKKTQGMFEQFAGGVFNNMPKNATTDTESADGNVVVFTFGIDSNSAREQMHLNAKVLGGLGSTAQQPLDGIGDEAFAEADSMIMVRKGDKLIRIMYMSCPCSTDAVKPLAKQLAARL
jgi:hypothetical protein